MFQSVKPTATSPTFNSIAFSEYIPGLLCGSHKAGQSNSIWLVTVEIVNNSSEGENGRDLFAQQVAERGQLLPVTTWLTASSYHVANSFQLPCG